MTMDETFRSELENRRGDFVRRQRQQPAGIPGVDRGPGPRQRIGPNRGARRPLGPDEARPLFGLSPPGQRAPVGDWNYEPQPDRSWRVYPPGIEAPAGAQQATMDRLADPDLLAAMGHALGPDPVPVAPPDAVPPPVAPPPAVYVPSGPGAGLPVPLPGPDGWLPPGTPSIHATPTMPTFPYPRPAYGVPGGGPGYGDDRGYGGEPGPGGGPLPPEEEEDLTGPAPFIPGLPTMGTPHQRRP